MYRRCPSAYRVSNASELFPEPDGPVMTMSARCGSSTVIPCRLFCRALTMRIIWRKHSGFGERSGDSEDGEDGEDGKDGEGGKPNLSVLSVFSSSPSSPPTAAPLLFDL